MTGNEDILIVAVDSIKIRKNIAKTLIKNDHWPKYIIDGRMGLEQMEIYTYRSPLTWLNDLPDENNVDHEPCTAKAIAYNTSVIGGLISSIIKKIIKGEKFPQSIIFDLTTYTAIIQSES